MDVAVICNSARAEQTLNKDSWASAWNHRVYRMGETVFYALWSQAEIVGLSCGWTEWRDGWALWSAEDAALFELRRKLSISSLVPDADVMCAALDRWGTTAPEQIHSMWAGAVWQESRQELCFFRDRIGLTPAFHCHDFSAQTRVFSTSMGLVHQICPGATSVNQNRMPSFLLGMSDIGRDDFFETVSRLRPGESWFFNLNDMHGEPEIHRYWQPGVRKSSISNQLDAAQLLLETLQHICADYLRAGYESISSVSGGLDSTLMLSIQLEQAQKLGIDPSKIAAATMGFPSFPDVDETIWTDQLQRFLKHPIDAINVEDLWPMKVPSYYTEMPELGPDFHAGSIYENAFVGRAIEKYGRRPVFLGIGADQLLLSSPGQAVAGLLADRNLPALRQVYQASQLAGLSRVALYLVGQTSLGEPLRNIREWYYRAIAADEFPWRIPENWVRLESGPSAGEVDMTILNPRARFLSDWNWEYVVRALRRESYRLGVANHMPYLRADFVEATVSLSPELFYVKGYQKGLQRIMAAGYLPDSIRSRPKGGVFSKIVEYGLGICEYEAIREFFETTSVFENFSLIDPDAFLAVLAKYHSFCSANQGRLRSAGEAYLWRTIAARLWMASVG